MSDSTENSCICGKWTLGREIGRGAYGVVYLATASDGSRAAVKVCRRDALDVQSYERELRGARLYHAIPPCEGLVRMGELVEEDWGFCAVMDLADDDCGSGFDSDPSAYTPKTLARVISGAKALPLRDCVRLGVILAGGLATLQRRLLLHRDIKPENVLYVKGRPVLSDPGLVVEESKAASLVGTPGYVPPERFTSAGSDVYSLGLTLKAASFGRRLEDLDKGPAIEADTTDRHFPAWWRILNKATDPTPARRYQSAKALLKDLSALERSMNLSSAAHSRMAKVLCACLLALLAFAFAYILAPDSDSKVRTERLRKDVANQGERISSHQSAIDALHSLAANEELYKARMQRNAKWDWFCLDIDAANDAVTALFIEMGPRKDAAGDARVRDLVEKRKGLLERRRELLDEINALRAEARRKESAGLDDTEEFTRAEALCEDRMAIQDEINAIVDEIGAITEK